MQPEVGELRAKLKEILYDCAVEIRATKAALYLLDPNTRRFDLVTEYGFRNSARAHYNYTDPLIDKCQRGRAPFYVNSVAAEPRLSELMFASATERLLAAPLYLRAQLVGLIDMRDKAAKLPFEQSDLSRAQSIADRILGLFVNKNIFGQRFVTLADTHEVMPIPGQRASDLTEPRAVPAASAASAASAPTAQKSAQLLTPPPPAMQRLAKDAPASLKVHSIVAKARTEAARIILPSVGAELGEEERAAVREILRATLFLPQAVAVMFTAIGRAGSFQEIHAKGPLASEAQESLQSKLHSWLSKRGESTGPLRAEVQMPLGAVMPAVQAGHLGKVYTAPVITPALKGMYLTAAFEQAPERSTHEVLGALLNQMQIAIEHAQNRVALHRMRHQAAAELMEPRFSSFSDLRRHCEQTAACAEGMAHYLGLTSDEVQTVKLTAMAHDCGMRLLDYERLYKKPEVTPEEMALLRDHVLVGAALAEPLLGTEVARAILCHHERVDGGGYPNQLRGSEIPLPARILQICDAYLSIVEPAYQVHRTHAQAMDIIQRESGAQFDAEIAVRFVEFMKAAGRS